MSEKNRSRENWEIQELIFKPDMSLEESYGYLDIIINDNAYIFDEVVFASDLREIDDEFITEFLEDNLEEEDFKSLVEEDFEVIAKECTRDLKSW